MRTLKEIEEEMRKNNLEGEEVLKRYMNSPSRELKKEYAKSIRQFSSLVREYNSVIMAEFNV